MRLLTDEHVGVYLDAIGHRVETGKESDTRWIDLTLRIQPLTPALAGQIAADVRALLFGMLDAEPRSTVKALEFALAVPAQTLRVRLIPDLALAEMAVGEYAFPDCEIGRLRARTHKDVDGYALTFRASFANPSARDLEYVNAWLTEQRFVTFLAAQPDLFDEARDVLGVEG